MKNKYKSIYSDYYKEHVQYINITDYLKEYHNYSWNEAKLETEGERLAREKAEKRNSKIDQILG